MHRTASALLAALLTLSLSACMETGPALPAVSDAAPALAPPIPVDNRAKADFARMTGINSDAVAAISGDAARSYIYFDLFAANKEAVAAAPERLCRQYGKSLKTSHVTDPGDRVPGMKALVVECK
ncbi:hypothetical protein FBT96_09605 [Rhodobacter capsulatus]|uniref:Lipoprotein n=1 Tax=Rhodobacter capsulatus TaxID=1061 RepID=A0A4U1JQV0_RHOCA|nr:hypothetical protein [Rhodobacter capsulatus]TKD21340.1 hypothetical protein FBT96_09605 [Rhodobacter capsulatus]